MHFICSVKVTITDIFIYIGVTIFKHHRVPQIVCMRMLIGELYLFEWNFAMIMPLNSSNVTFASVSMELNLLVRPTETSTVNIKFFHKQPL